MFTQNHITQLQLIDDIRSGWECIPVITADDSDKMIDSHSV